MKPKLPKGARVGSILFVTWHRDGAGVVEVEVPFEGRLLEMKDNNILVRFTYTDGTPEEDIKIDLNTGLDLKYGQPVSDIKLRGLRGRSRSTDSLPGR